MNSLSIVVHKSSDDFAASVAKEIADVIFSGKKPVVLGLATGSTPIPVYKHLVGLLKGKDLSHVHSFNLDEYEGLSNDNDQSYHFFMRHHLFDHISVPAHQIHFPSGDGSDYDAQIQKAGGLDIQLLGIGVNGHIGFNEPGSAVDSRTRRVELSDETRHSNARFFGGDKNATPSHATTMGVATIANARRVLLCATGSSKADIMKALLSHGPGPYSTDLPASVLLRHPNCQFHLDALAAAKLN